MLLRLVHQPFCTSTVIVKVQSVLELGPLTFRNFSFETGVSDGTQDERRGGRGVWKASGASRARNSVSRGGSDPDQNRGLWRMPHRPACRARRLAGEAHAPLHSRP